MSYKWLHFVCLASIPLVWACSSSRSNDNGSAGSEDSEESGGSNQGAKAGGGSKTSNAGGAGSKSTASDDKAGGGSADHGGDASGSKAGGGSAKGGSAGAGTGGKAGVGGSKSDAGPTTGSGGSADGGKEAGVVTGAGGAAKGDSGTGDGTVKVQLDAVHQTIQGFGINDTWASDAVPSSLFSTSGDGIGLSILRIGMSDAGNDYTSTASSDASMVTKAGGKVIGSCWSPPANCKTNNNVNDGGHLKSSCYDSWSDTIVKWAQGHSLYAMSIGNEGDFASCGSSDPCNGNYPTTVYTAKEYVDWVKVAGPKLQKAGIKVIGPEASEWIHTWSNVSAGPDAAGKNSSDPLKCGCFGMSGDAASASSCAATCTSGDGYDYGHWLYKDTEAWKAFDILGVHEYDTQKAEPWPADVNGGKPDHEVWQTEMSGVKWWPEQGPSSDIKNGVAVAGWIHSALVDGETSAWLWWWYKAYNTDDNEGLLLKSGGSPTKRYYTFGNYSKFVRPGFKRVEVTGTVPADVLLSAYAGTDGSLVIVGINKGNADASVPITIAGGTAPASFTPNVTSANDNLKAGTAVTVSNGVLTAALASMTVTTFVSGK